jgi:hypothetical protein
MDDLRERIRLVTMMVDQVRDGALVKMSASSQKTAVVMLCEGIRTILNTPMEGTAMSDALKAMVRVAEAHQ